MSCLTHRLRTHGHPRHPDQLVAAGNARGHRRERRRAGAAHRARARARAGRQRLPGQGRARAAGHAKRVRRRRPGARRLPARGRPAHQQRRAHRRRAAGADRAPGVRRPDAAGAGDQGPDRHQGRAAVDADLASPGACWCSCRRTRTSASRRRSARPRRASSCARACRRWWATAAAASSCAPTPRMPATPNWPTTSPTCARPGRTIRERGWRSRAAGTLLHQDLNLAERVLRDLTNDATQTVRIDSQLQFDALQAFGARVLARRGEQARTLPRRAADLRPLQHRGETSCGRWRARVDLKSGGYLIIDQTEALTTIDVNTGGFVGARNFDDTIFKTNLEAALAIGAPAAPAQPGRHHHRRLHRHDARGAPQRRAGGVRKQLARDRTKTTVSGFTQLGLVEMTRKRTRESLAHVLCEPCPTCEGRGQVKTARSVLLRHPARDPARGAAVQPQGVSRHRQRRRWWRCCSTKRARTWPGLSEFVGKPISLSAESAMNPEQYDIVLDVTARGRRGACDRAITNGCIARLRACKGSL